MLAFLSFYRVVDFTTSFGATKNAARIAISFALRRLLRISHSAVETLDNGNFSLLSLHIYFIFKKKYSKNFYSKSCFETKLFLQVKQISSCLMESKILVRPWLKHVIHYGQGTASISNDLLLSGGSTTTTMFVVQKTILHNTNIVVAISIMPLSNIIRLVPRLFYLNLYASAVIF